jgi:hypothetical protein
MNPLVYGVCVDIDLFGFVVTLSQGNGRQAGFGSACRFSEIFYEL